MNIVSFNEFRNVELRIGKVLSAERIEHSEKLIKLSVAVGEENPRQIIAGIGKAYGPEELLGRIVVVVVNLEPKQLMGHESQGMLLAASEDGIPVLLRADRDVLPGTAIH